MNQENEVLERLRRIASLSDLGGIVKPVPTDSRTRRFIPRLEERGLVEHYPWGLWVAPA